MKKILSIILGLVLLSGITTFAQTNGSFKSVRFYNVPDSAEFLATTWANFIARYPDSGGLYYNEQSNKFRVYQNGAWQDLTGGGGGGGGGNLSGTLTTPRVPYATGANTLGDNANFTWDNTNSILTVKGARTLMQGTNGVHGHYFGYNAGSTATFVNPQGLNTGFGYESLQSLINGPNVYDASYNTAMGYNTLKSVTTGAQNTAIGFNVMRAGSTIGNNTGVGATVMSNASFSGSSNTGVGYRVLFGATTGSENTAIGYTALQSLTTGGRNVAVGGNLLALTTGNYNTVVGNEGFELITTESQNTGLGFWAGVYARGVNNTFLGAYAGGQATNPATNLNNNTFVGTNAGVTNTPANASISGDNNTFVGYESGLGSTTQVSGSSAFGYRAKVYTNLSMTFGSEIDADRVNYGFGGESYSGGKGVFFVKNAVTNTSSLPTNGFNLHSQTGYPMFTSNDVANANVIGFKNTYGTANLVYATGAISGVDLNLTGASGFRVNGYLMGTNRLVIGGAGITAGSVLADFQSTTQGILLPRVTNIASVTTPVAGMVAYDAATNKFNFRENATWVQLGGGGTPAGSNTQVQYNNAGAFGASSTFTFNSGTNVLTIASGSNSSLIGPTTFQANTTGVSTDYKAGAINATSGQLNIQSISGGATEDIFITANSLADIALRVNGGTEVIKVTGVSGNPKIHIDDGTNGPSGNATLVAGTVTVNNTNVTANSKIFVTVQTPGGTQGFLSVSRSVGTSFTITSTSALETSVISWFLIEPM